MKRGIIAVICVGALALALCAGCTQQMIIGEDADGASSFTLTNGSGVAVSSVEVKSSWSDDWSTTLAQDGDFDNEAVATVYVDEASYEVPDNASAAEASDSGVDIVLEPLADFRISTSDGMQYELHQLNVSDIKEATLKIQDGTAYLEYTSNDSGSTVNTYDSEIAYQEELKAEEEAAAKAAEEAAAAQAAAEQAAAEEAAAQEEAKASQSSSSSSSKSSGSSSSSGSNSSGSSSSSSGSGSSGSSSGSSSASGGEDACVDDLVLN